MFKNKSVVELFLAGSRWLLAAVFVAAGFPKLLAPQDFALTIADYGLLPDGLVLPAAVILPLIELIVAVGLLFKRRWAFYLSVGLLIMFIAVLSYGIHLGLGIDCGCFGPNDPQHASVAGLKTALYRDLMLLVPAGFLVWSSSMRKKIA